MITPDGLCDCHCGNVCPFGRTGSAGRCSLVSLAGHFGCPVDDALGQLHAWWPIGEVEVHRRFEAMRREFDFRIAIVEAERPD